MPSKDIHINQYKHNKSLLENKCFDIEDSIYLDWVVTIIFYSAVHIVESVLSETEDHSGSHVVRNGFVERYVKLKPICDEYSTLYRQSKKARYMCAKYNKRKINDVLDLLKCIEAKLLAV